MNMNGTHIATNDPTQQIIFSSILATVTAPTTATTDRTGLFIALFLLFLLFILIGYLFYSFLTLKYLSSQGNHVNNKTNDVNLENRNMLEDTDDLNKVNNDCNQGRQSSFSDGGTSLYSSSIRSHLNPRFKRTSSYRLCSQTSNYLITPRISSQLTINSDGCTSTPIIVEPNDAYVASALSRSISKYYERQRKPKLKRRTQSYEDLMLSTELKPQNLLHGAKSLSMRRKTRPKNQTRNQILKPDSQVSIRKKPTTIYELYKSDRMRISNLLVSDP